MNVLPGSETKIESSGNMEGGPPRRRGPLIAPFATLTALFGAPGGAFLENAPSTEMPIKNSIPDAESAKKTGKLKEPKIWWR